VLNGYARRQAIVLEQGRIVQRATGASFTVAATSTAGIAAGAAVKILRTPLPLPKGVETMRAESPRSCIRCATPAKVLGWSYPRAEQWIYQRQIKTVKTPGGHHRSRKQK